MIVCLISLQDVKARDLPNRAQTIHNAPDKNSHEVDLKALRFVNLNIGWNTEILDFVFKLPDYQLPRVFPSLTGRDLCLWASLRRERAAMKAAVPNCQLQL
jgi:hypothetical protein